MTPSSSQGVGPQTSDELSSQLKKLSEVVASSRSPDQVLQSTVELLPPLFGCETGSLILRHQERLIFKVPLGEKKVTESLKDYTIPVDRPSFAGEVLKTGRSIISNDVATDPRFNPEADRLTGFKTRNILAVPIAVDGEVMGVMEAINHPTGFSEDDQNRVLHFAAFVGIALQNALRFEQVQALGADLERAHQKLVATQEEMVRLGQLAALGELAAVMAHDLQQKLALANMSAEEIALSTASFESGEAGPFTRLLSTIRDMESITKLLAQFARKGEEAWETTRLEPLLKKPLDILDETIRRFHVNVSYNVPHGGPELRCIPRQLEHLFLNVLAHCLTAAGKVATREIRIWSDTPRAGWVFVHIADSGPLPPPYLSDLLFLPFGMSRFEGEEPGLGLAVARVIAERHMGRLTAKTEGESGLEFVIELPLNPRA